MLEIPDLGFPAEVTDPGFHFLPRDRSHAPPELFQNTVIIGERKSGKTTEINWRRDQLATLGVSSDVLSHHDQPHEMAEQILESICLKTRGITLGQTDYMQRYPLNPPSVLQLHFKIIVNDLWDYNPDFRLMLFIDEIENILERPREISKETMLEQPREINKEMRQFMAFLTQKDQFKGSLRLTFTINQTREAFETSYSPFALSCKLMILEPLEADDTRSFVEWLVRDRCKFDEDAQRMLFEQGGGRYFFTKGILDALFKLYGHEPEGFTFSSEHIRNASLRSIHHHEVALTLENIWKTQFSSEERAVAQWCVDGFKIDEFHGSEEDHDKYSKALDSLNNRFYLRLNEQMGWMHRYSVISSWRKQQPSYLIRHSKKQLGSANSDKGDVPMNRNVSEPELQASQVIQSYSLEHLPLLSVDDGMKQVYLGSHIISLAPKPYKVLNYLFNNKGRRVGYNEIAQAAWPEYYNEDALKIAVSDEMINGAVAAIRREIRKGLKQAIGDGYTDDQITKAVEKYISTKVGFGYMADKDLLV